MSTLSLAWRLILRPRTTIDEAISASRSTLWMIPVFWVISVELLIDDPSELIGDPGSIWYLPLFALGLAFLQYYLVYRIENWVAILLGGSTRFTELRWIHFLVGIIESVLFLTVALVYLGLLLQGVSLPELYSWSLLGLFLVFPNLWLWIVLILSVSRLYNFSVARTFFLGTLSSFLICLPLYLIIPVYVLLESL